MKTSEIKGLKITLEKAADTVITKISVDGSSSKEMFDVTTTIRDAPDTISKIINDNKTKPSFYKDLFNTYRRDDTSITFAERMLFKEIIPEYTSFLRKLDFASRRMFENYISHEIHTQVEKDLKNALSTEEYFG